MTFIECTDRNGKTILINLDQVEAIGTALNGGTTFYYSGDLTDSYPTYHVREDFGVIAKAVGLVCKVIDPQEVL